MKIIKFEEKYRDDMIYMILSRKASMGKIPHINNDLLDIKTNYFDKGHPFWIALNEFDRVVGCIGTKTDENNNIFLSHLFVKNDYQRKGIGSKLLALAEESARTRGYQEIHVHLGKDYLESHLFYPKHGYYEYQELYMKKEL